MTELLSSNIEFIGYLGAGFMALCGLPTAFLAIKRGNGKHIDNGLYILWSLGEIFSIIYALQFNSIQLNINYLTNLFFLAIIGFYKVFPRK